jgi:tRNA pseudouridine55 synthase
MMARGGLGAGGILLVDKPRGMTSHDVVAAVRKLVGPLRVGHTGTLDPLATGLLILCIGRATRVAEILEAESKVYRATVLLGLRTETQDVEGTVIETRPVSDIPEERIRQVAESFIGWIEQTPPAFSAVKIGGVRAYRLARRRQVVLLKPRRVEIKRLVLEEIHLPEIDFTVECSRGTYIRTLCDDFGAALEVGGCLKSLRRLEVGRFSVGNAAPLSQLNTEGDVVQALLPLSEALAHLTKISCSEEEIHPLLHGMRIQVNARVEPAHAVKESNWICAFGPDNIPVALGRLAQEGETIFFQPKKLLVDPALDVS